MAMSNIRVIYTFLIALIFTLGLNAQGWEMVSDVPFNDHHTNGYGFNGKGYLIQGGANGNSNTLWEYTPDGDIWTDIGEFPGTERGFAIGDDWQGKYYYGFGLANSGPLTDLWVFDPVDTSFVQLPSCPCTPRYHPAFVAHNDKIFMGTGSSGNGNLGDWWEYDMITMQWTQKPSMPGQTRHHPFQFAMDEYIYVGGGHRDNWARYDPATETWLAIDNAPLGRVAGAQFSYDGRGYVLAGDDAVHDHIPDNETFMSYDPVSDDWAYLPSLPNGSRWANSSMVVDDILYFFGGVDYDVQVNDISMWKFDMTTINCLAVQNPRISSADTSSVDLIWTSFGQSISDTLLWREQGATDWNSVVNPQVVYTLDGLATCAEYEFQVASTCDTQVTYSDIVSFRTEGCCVEPDLNVTIDAVTASLSWNSIFDAQEYNVRYRALGVTGWIEVITAETTLVLTDLLECQDYQFEIGSICDGEDLNFGEGIFMKTENCMSNTFETSAISSIRAYPNPFNQVLRFKSELQNLSGFNLNIKDILGRDMLSVSNYSLDHDLDVSSLTPGIYFLTLEREGQLQTLKLLKS